MNRPYGGSEPGRLPCLQTVARPAPAAARVGASSRPRLCGARSSAVLYMAPEAWRASFKGGDKKRTTDTCFLAVTTYRPSLPPILGAQEVQQALGHNLPDRALATRDVGIAGHPGA